MSCHKNELWNFKHWNDELCFVQYSRKLKTHSRSVIDKSDWPIFSGVCSLTTEQSMESQIYKIQMLNRLASQHKIIRNRSRLRFKTGITHCEYKIKHKNSFDF